MKTVALIPIKINSGRLALKNLKTFFDGTPLMTFIQKACLEAKNIDDVYVYCSDEHICEFVLPEANFLKRPEYLNGDNINANDIIKEFIKVVDADIYVNAHATSPFAKSETIDTCIEKVKSGKFDSAFCVSPVRSFLWKENKPLNYNINSIPRTQDLPAIYAEAPISYVFIKDVFQKYGRRTGINPYMKEVNAIEAIDIDYPEDFFIANAVYRELKGFDNKFNCNNKENK